MNTRKDRVIQQLGMPPGTAANRLRKNILFSFMKRLKEDVCFKCGACIERVEDLSIEHKLPWENRSPELFWDLNNIAFSHLYCNRQHVFGAQKLRKIGPEGTSWCSVCKNFLPPENFYKNRSTWSGVKKECSKCSIVADNRTNHAKISRPLGQQQSIRLQPE
jgi:hypothetical protein